MSVQFSPKTEKRFEEIVARYPRRDAALLPILWLAQKEFEFLSPEVRAYVASKVGVSLARVESVISFYTLYYTKRMGTHHIQVCRNLSCCLRGGESLTETVREELGIGPGETTTDGKFSFSTVECLAACGGAPALQINGDYHEQMSPEKLRDLIGELKERGKDR